MVNDTFSVVFNNADVSSGLTITELMYNDPGNYDNLDYIELYNNSNKYFNTYMFLFNKLDWLFINNHFE